MLLRWMSGALVLLGVVACGGTATMQPADAGQDAGPSGDAGPMSCVPDSSCDDGVYCNGVELRCTGGGTAPRCVSGAAIHCGAQACDEENDRCACETDADGDGSCAAVDCDDSDPLRSPELDEVCDAESVDEDCDPTTFGTRDLDGDLHVDASCCNADASGALVCGTDCDDATASTHVGQVEVCNVTDDDCDGFVDEGASGTLFRDADGDGFGDDTMTIAACAVMEGYVLAGGDCDDAAASRNPAVSELCNEIDDDCDGVVDEGC